MLRRAAQRVSGLLASKPTGMRDALGLLARLGITPTTIVDVEGR